MTCLAQKHNTMIRPGFEPGPFDPESGAQTIKGIVTLWDVRGNSTCYLTVHSCPTCICQLFMWVLF